MGREHRLGAQAGKGRLPHQHLVRHRAEGVEIGALIDVRLGGSLLRSHVGRGAEGEAERGQRAGAGGLAHRFGDAEVGDEGVPSGEQDVVRLDVPVNHPLAVGIRESVDHLTQDSYGFGDRQLTTLGELGAQRFALDEGHGVPEQVAGGAGRQQWDDMRMLKPGGELNFAAEAILVDAGRHLRRKDLDDDLAAQGDFVGEEDPTHPATPQLLVEQVLGAEGGLEPGREVGHAERY